ncbi:MAG: Dabb family protein [Bacteroidales bacterium]|nr:Dabb family protein [Bacteroidales bacterium]
MKRRNFIKNTGLAALAGTGMAASGCNVKSKSSLAPGQIRHGVIFTLKYKKGSAEADKFLEDGRKILSAIPVVQHFMVYRQVSTKNEYDYGFTMVFDNMEDYATYNDHPDHVDFVENRWKTEVEKFLEIDFELY